MKIWHRAGNLWWIRKLLQKDRLRLQSERNVYKLIFSSKDELRRKFADCANSFSEDLSEISKKVTTLEGNLEQQLDITNSLISQMSLLKNHLTEAESLNRECDEANIEENEYVLLLLISLIYNLFDRRSRI